MNPTTSLTFSANGGTPGIGVTGSGTFAMATDATVIFDDSYGTQEHTVNGNATFSNVNIAGVGVNFGSNSTLTGNLQIFSGGYVNTNAPTYADNSTLTYATEAAYTVGSEWFANVSSGQGVPFNVVVTNGTTLDFGVADRTLRGSLTLTNGSTLNGAASHTLTVQNDVILNNSATLNAPNLLQVGGDWDNSNGSTFNHQNKTVQFNGNTLQTIVDTHNTTTFYNMEVLSGSTVSIPNPVLPAGTEINVSNQLTNNGTLQQTLTAPGNATTTFLNITNGSGTDKYFGVQITIPDDADMGSTTVKVRGNSVCTSDDTSGHVHRCFDITPTTSTAADVTFYYLNSEINGNTAANVFVWHWNSGWQKETGTYTRSSSGDYQSVQVTGVDQYSPFVLDDVDPGAPTAITLSDFVAQSSSAPVWIFAGIAVIALILGGAALRRKRPSPTTPSHRER